MTFQVIHAVEHHTRLINPVPQTSISAFFCENDL